MEVGFAIGLDTVVELNPVDGVQLYVLPPTDVEPIVVEAPLQIDTFDPAAATGNGFTVTVTLLDEEHPVAVTVSVTVYVVVVVGFAVGLDTVDELNPVDGVQA